ncbi:alpha/beta hydrolase [Roseivirga sp.]|uniref:alpha/beta hydrolase n=1 Tax=Roseivirga sp. TaxID=1964215 RepID=UPI003B5237A7
MKFLRLIPILLLITACNNTQQSVPENKSASDIIIGEKHSIYSESLGENRELLISLPPNYKRNQHAYPVVFVLDAEYLFEVTHAIVKIKSSRNEMPESIIVGIPNTTDARYDMALALHYSNGNTFFGDATGEKIQNYLSFFKKELMPFVQDQYRVNDHHTIIGMSPTFGPVLTAFWEEPELFDASIILAAELTLITDSGETIAERTVKAIQDQSRNKSAIYIGKAGDDLLRRPEEEALAYEQMNQQLEQSANPNISYTIEILEEENHYGMALKGIENGLETLYPFETWNIPYREFWNSENPAQQIKRHYQSLSLKYGFEVLPLEDSFYAAQNLIGTLRRLERNNRPKAYNDVLKLALTYYPNSPALQSLEFR